MHYMQHCALGLPRHTEAFVLDDWLEAFDMTCSNIEHDALPVAWRFPLIPVATNP